MAYTTRPLDTETIANLPGDIRAVTDLVTSHTDATSAAHNAGAISYGTGNVRDALDTAAGHKADQNNPHNVTAAQAGAVAIDDAVTTITANKVVRRDANAKIAGDITGNAATSTALLNGGKTIIPSSDGTQVKFQVDTSMDVPVHNAALLQGMTPAQIEAAAIVQDLEITGTLQTDKVTSATGAKVDYFTGTNAGHGYNTYGHTKDGVSAGTYSLKALLQALVNSSHKHVIQGSYNANCATNCCDGCCVGA